MQSRFVLRCEFCGQNLEGLEVDLIQPGVIINGEFRATEEPSIQHTCDEED